MYPLRTELPRWIKILQEEIKRIQKENPLEKTKQETVKEYD